MGVVVVVQVAVLQENVLLGELATAKTEVGIEIPVLIGHRSADTGISNRSAALQGSEIAVIICCVGHHAGTNGELHLLLGVLELQSGVGVEILSCCCQSEDCHKRH